MDTPRPSPRTNRTRRVPHPVLIGRVHPAAHRPPPPRTKWTRRVPHPVPTRHVSSLPTHRRARSSPPSPHGAADPRAAAAGGSAAACPSSRPPSTTRCASTCAPLRPEAGPSGRTRPCVPRRAQATERALCEWRPLPARGVASRRREGLRTSWKRTRGGPVGHVRSRSGPVGRWRPRQRRHPPPPFPTVPHTRPPYRTPPGFSRRLAERCPQPSSDAYTRPHAAAGARGAGARRGAALHAREGRVWGRRGRKPPPHLLVLSGHAASLTPY